MIVPSQSKLFIYDPEIKYDFKGEKYSFDADLKGVSGNTAPPPWNRPKYFNEALSYERHVTSYVKKVVKLVRASPGTTTMKIFPRELREKGLYKLTGSDFKIASRGLYHLYGIEVTHIYSGHYLRDRPLDDPKQVVLEYSKDNPILFPYSTLQEPRENNPTVDFAFTFEDSDMRLPCHKYVLSSRSDYFEKLFTGGFKEGGTSELVVRQGTKPHVINIMLDFLYTGRAPIESLAQDELMKLLELSKLYGLDYLAKTCASHLKTFINENTVAELLEFAQEFDVKDVKNRCKDFLLKNLGEENAQEIHLLAQQYDMPDLIRICRRRNPQLEEEKKEKDL